MAAAERCASARAASSRALALVVGDLVLAQGADQVGGVGVADPVERHQLRQRYAAGQRHRLTVDQVGVGARRAADGLRGVVDEDVEGSGRGDLLGQCHHLGGVAQVDADDLEAVQPVGRVLLCRKASRGIVREPRRDRQVGAVAQEHQRDVHADLGAPAGEQGPAAGEVGALVALGVAQLGAVGAQPVVEGVDDGVLGLADVAAARLDQLAGVRAPGRRDQREALGLVVDAQRRTGGGAGEHRLVVVDLRLTGLAAAGLAHLLVHAARGAFDRLQVGVAGVEVRELGQDAQGGGQVVGVDAGSVGVVGVGRHRLLGHRLLGHRLRQASGSAASAETRSLRLPDSTSARLVSSSTERRLARTATQTVGRCSATPS